MFGPAPKNKDANNSMNKSLDNVKDSLMQT